MSREEREDEKSGEGAAGVWVVTKGTAEIEVARRRKYEEVRILEERLAKCPVCGGRARIVEFGLEGNGVWIGCDRTAECSGYIEIHTEGWSVKEVAEEWNHYNRGVNLVIRKVKKILKGLIGEEKRKEKREKRREKAEKRAKEARLREILGIEEPKKWWKIEKKFSRRQKVSG